MILLWGVPGEAPMAAVRAVLARLGCAVAVLDQRAALETEIDLEVGAAVSGIVRVGAQRIDLATVRAAYVRPYDSRRLPGVAAAGAGSPLWRHALDLEDALWSWAALTPALVVNRPAAMAANGSKPYQAAQLRGLGFEVPAALITTDAAAAREFWGRYGTVIYKSISGVRSVVSRLRPADLGRLADLPGCPTQFQQYVPGDDYRVHVVGDEVFACRIVSDADDYRYAAQQGAGVRVQSCELPAALAARCRTLAAALDLPVAGVDLRRTPDGRWYCFEVNPSPGFTYYQEATQQPISAAVARLLAAA